MTIKRKWRYISLLFFAGLVSLLSSLFGCFGIFGFLFQYPHLAKELIPFLLLVLEFPLFLLAVSVSGRFMIPLWAFTFIYPFALILLANDIFVTKSFLIQVAGVGTISFALVAMLLHYSTHFYPLPIGIGRQGSQT